MQGPQKGIILTAARVAELAAGRKLAQLQALDLGLERLQSFGSALDGCRALIELHARSNRLTTLAGGQKCLCMSALRLSPARTQNDVVLCLQGWNTAQRCMS